LVALFASITISFAQGNDLIYVNLHNEKVQCKVFDFDNSDSRLSMDLRFCCKKSYNEVLPIFEVSNAYYDTAMSPSHTNWRFHLRAEENDTISLLNDWKQTWSHVFYGLGAIHEEFHTAICNNLPDGNRCYGWISYRVDAGDDPFDLSDCWITFYEYAYCTIPGYPLRIGQTSLNDGIDETEATASATLHPNPTTGLVTITGENLKAAEVLNTLEQRVATASGEGETLQVDISGLPAGVYFVNVTDGEGRKCTRKVVKE